MTETITTSTPALSPKATRKYTAKRPLTLLLAILFFIAAALPVILIAQPVAVVNSEAPIVSSEPETEEMLSVSDKIDMLATTIETACYSDGTKGMHELFLYGTWTVFICIIVSSLIMGSEFLMLFLSVKLESFTRTCLLAAGTITAITASAIFIVMHIYSSVVIIGEFGKITAQNLEAAAENQKITETLTYLLRNLAVAAALVFYTYRFAMFTFSSDNQKLSLKKLSKLTKNYKSACVAVALVCCFFASTIALTWTFDLAAKTLLWMLVIGAVVFFTLTAFLHSYSKYVKKLHAHIQIQENP